MIALLRDESTARMENLDEFSLLRESIDFFREKRDETTVSLDLEERQEKRSGDLALQTSFRERRKMLGDSFFPYEAIFLDGKDDVEDESSVEEEEVEPLDIVLREGIRIMSDWLSLQKKDGSDQQLAQSEA